MPQVTRESASKIALEFLKKQKNMKDSL